MQNNFIYPYTSEEFWRKRPHPSRVDDNDSDDDEESSTTGSPWRAMKRLRVAGPLQDDARDHPDIERVVSHTESVASKEEDYANFNKMLGALHLERRNRELVRATPVQPHSSSDPSVLQQQHVSQGNMVDSQMMMTTPDRGCTRRNQTKLKTQSKLA